VIPGPAPRRLALAVNLLERGVAAAVLLLVPVRPAVEARHRFQLFLQLLKSGAKQGFQ
jgi:hypothetical protein